MNFRRRKVPSIIDSRPAQPSLLQLTRDAGLLAIGGSLTAMVFTAADSLHRFEWPAEPALLFGVSTFLLRWQEGLLAATLFLSLRYSLLVAQGYFPFLRSKHLDLGLFAVATITACQETAFWTFSGRLARRLPAAPLLPFLMLFGLGLGVFVYGLFFKRAFHRKQQTRTTLFILSSGLLSLGLVRIDSTYLVALYSGLHELLEWMAIVLLTGAFTLLIPLRTQTTVAVRSTFQCSTLYLLAYSLAWVLTLVPSFEPISTIGAHTLTRDPGYGGRSRTRISQLSEFIKNPFAHHLSASTLRERMIERFDLQKVSLDAKWSSAHQDLETPKVRPPPQRIVVFYVDTLRADIASDPQVMPRVARFLKEESLSFSRAYSSGAETSQALPDLLAGRYSSRKNASDFLALATKAGMKTISILPQSARQFFNESVPQFQFDEEISIDDSPSSTTELRGYGSKSTAAQIVAEAEQWLTENQEKSFLLWLSHFDVHNWSQLKDKKYNPFKGSPISKNGLPVAMRYLDAATGVDQAFAQLHQKLQDLALLSSTLLIVLSDHGEALGYRGMLTHSVFLWEPVIRIPLAFSGPGFTPGQVTTPVSLIDILPTTANWLGMKTLRATHGEDLRKIAAGASRRAPPLLVGSRGRQRHLLGVVDGDFKLVLPLDSLQPALYHLTKERNEDQDWSINEPGRVVQLLNELATSPLFPR